jgi:hypothetical protein
MARGPGEEPSPGRGPCSTVGPPVKGAGAAGGRGRGPAGGVKLSTDNRLHADPARARAEYYADPADAADGG